MTKEAGATVYLMEELGDARMRCDQLVRYIAEAVKLIENSGQKDQFFEVGGHLIHAIPDTLFRLQKALQAVALAAGRIDYEELKQELKPEKVQQLENVLQDVRIRQVQRRSQPWTPEQVAQKLQALAAQATKEGSVSAAGLIDVILGLEMGQKNAAVEDTAATLNQLADSLQAGEPSRLILAAALRRMLGDAQIDMVKETTMDRDAARYSGDPVWIRARYPGTADDGTPFRKGEEVLYWPRSKTFMVGAKAQAAWRKFQSEIEDEAFYNMSHMANDDEEKESRFEEGKPADPTKNMSPEDKAKWKKQKEEHKDEFKSAAAEAWKVEAASEYVAWVEDKNGHMVHFAGPMSQSDARRKAKSWDSIVEDGGSVTVSPIDRAKRDLSHGSSAWFSKLPAADKSKLEALKTAAQEQRSRFEEGKPADPTKNMSPEDKAKWKKQKEEHKDEFKSAAEAWKVDAFAMGELNNIGRLERMVTTTERQLKELKHSLDLLKKDPQKYAPQEENFGAAVHQIMSAGKVALRSIYGPSYRVAEDDKTGYAFDADTIAPDTERLSFAMSAILQAAKYGMNYAKQGNRRRALLSMIEVLRAINTFMALEGGNTSPGDLLRRELLTMARHPAPAQAERLGYAFDADEDKESRFEEGKPADPTKNMSPEDKAKWKKQKEEHKDEFKTAGAKEALKFVELNGKLQKLIRLANRGQGLEWLQEAYNVLAEYAWLFRGDRWALTRFNPVIDEVQDVQRSVASLGSTLKTLGVIVKKNELGLAQHLNPDEQMTEPEWKAYR